VEDIASGLICLCGCGKLLNVCDMDTAKEMKSIIGDKLAEGWGKKEIVDYMTATYGEKVLAAPTKKGFNLTAWITPFALIFIGAALIGIVVQAWVRHRRATREEEIEIAVSQELESRYGKTLEKELKEFEG
jgi:cytochrome c-type biogenesis protein CcmH